MATPTTSGAGQQPDPNRGVPEPRTRPSVSSAADPGPGSLLTDIETAGVNAWLADAESALALTTALGQALAALDALR